MADKPADPYEIMLTDVRLSHPHLFEPHRYMNDPESRPAYQATAIIDPTTPAGKKLDDAIKRIIAQGKKDKWKDKPPSLKADRVAYKKGKADKPEQAGKILIVAKNPKPTFKLLDRRRNQLRDDGTLYAGCFVNMIVRFWFQDDKWGVGINCSLEGVQFVRHGDAFGRAPVSDDAFPELGDDPDDPVGDNGAASDQASDQASDDPTGDVEDPTPDDDSPV